MAASDLDKLRVTPADPDGKAMADEAEEDADDPEPQSDPDGAG